MLKTLLTGATLALATSLSAQVNAGFLFNVGAGATSRGAAAARPCQLLFPVPYESYRFWGDQTNPAGNTITGYYFFLQDQYAIVSEQYDVRFYGEDPANPHFPNFQPTQPVGTNELAHFGPFTSPASTTAGPAAWIITITFGTPLVLPNNQDVFSAVQLQQSGAANTAMTPPDWPNDGLSVQINLGVQPGTNFTVFDLKGARAVHDNGSGGSITANSYGIVHDVTNSTFAWGGARQGMCDLIVPSTTIRSVVTAITNQTSYTISNAAPGTASFYSGLHPDAAAPPFNGGRADNSAQVVQGALAGEVIFWFAAFDFQNPAFPLSGFVPGAIGSVCVDLNTFVNLGLSVATGSGTDSNVITWSAPARAMMPGYNLAYQALVVDPVTNTLRGTPCGMQRF